MSATPARVVTVGGLRFEHRGGTWWGRDVQMDTEHGRFLDHIAALEAAAHAAARMSATLEAVYEAARRVTRYDHRDFIRLGDWHDLVRAVRTVDDARAPASTVLFDVAANAFADPSLTTTEPTP